MKLIAFLRNSLVLATLVLASAGTVFAQRAVTATVTANQMTGTGSVIITLAAQGDESGVGFSLTFDPMVLRYDGKTDGLGLSGASLNINAANANTVGHANYGKIGVALALTSGTFTAGNKQLVLLNFTVLASASTSTPLGFGDSPVGQEISNELAESLPATYTGGTISASPLPSAPAITSASNTTFTFSQAGTFAVVANGSPASTFTVSVGTLPAGVALNPTTGVLSGTPTGVAGGINTFTIKASNGTSPDATQSFTLRINAPASITTQPANQSTFVGTPATFSVVAAGFPTSFSYQWKKGGDNIASATNASYTITSPQLVDSGSTYSVTVSNTIGTPVTSSAAMLTVSAAPVAPLFTSVNNAAFTLNQAGTFTVTATGIPTPTFSATGLPTGVTLNSAGVLGGPPTTLTGSPFVVTITAQNGTLPNATQAFTLTINPALTSTVAVASRGLTINTAAVAFTPVTFAGGTTPFTYSVTPSLPAGLSLNSTSGQITGTPTVLTATAAYTISITDRFGATTSKPFNLTVNVALMAGTTISTKTLNAGAAATAFTPLALTGGTLPYAWSVTPALPTGLTLDPATGAISGPPAAALAAVDFSVKGTDFAGAQVTQLLNLTINPVFATTLAVPTTTLNVNAGTPASFTPVTAAGGTTPYTFTVLSVLPAGLSLSSSSGAVTGNPSSAALSTNYTVTVTDNIGAVSSKTFNLTVNGPLTAIQAIATKALTATTAAGAFTPVTGAGGTPPYSYSINPAHPALPAGLTLNATGLITGTASAVSTAATFTITVTDSATTPATVTNTFSLTVNPALTSSQAIAAKGLTAGTAASAFTPVTAAGGTPNNTFTIAPSLPAGLSLSATTGAISGPPTAASSATNYTVTITDSVGATTSKVTNLIVNAVLAPVTSQTVASKALTAGTAAVAFTPLPLTGGTLPYAWSVSPALPTGLSLSATTGALTGTPTAATVSSVYTITVTDAAGASVTQALTLVVNPALAATQSIATRVLLTNVAAATFTPVTLTAGTGTAPVTFTLAPALPTGLSFATGTGAITGTPTVTSTVTTYTVTLTDAAGATASQTFTLAVNTAPVITAQPVSANVNLNGTAIFTVVATGFPAPTFQWKKDGVDITGNASATTATLTLANAQLTGEDAYTVAVTNASGTVTSSPAATLTVFVLPVITTAPVAQTILAGQNASFTVAATGKPAPTYQWRRNAVAIPGATSATLNLTAVPLNRGGDLTVVVTNASGAFGGTITSNVATLTVNPIAPVILSTPPLTATAVKDRTFLYGPITINNTPATFSATGLPAGLTVSPTLGNISGTPTEIPSSNPATIVLTVANLTGTDTRTITLTVLPPPPVITGAAAASGRVGTAFTFNVAATNSPTGYAATGLPGGLAINPSTGAITGTPTAAGTYTVQLTATNASGSVTQPVVLVIDPPLNAPVYTGPLNLAGTQGTAFAFTPAFGTVTAPYALTGTLPGGLAFTAATGVIAGTPTQTGTFALSLAATNAGGTTAVSLSLVINPAPAAPVITSASTAPAARVGTAFGFTLTSSGTPAATAYSATGLPSGLTLNAATGAISGTPAVFGTFGVAVSATNSVGTGPASVLSISVAPSASAPVITSSPIASGRVGETFSYTLTGTNSPTTFAITSGTLPAGLTLNAATGAITGTPLAAALGQTRVWFNASAGSLAGLSLEVLFTIAPVATVPVVNSNGTASAQVGQPFQYVITASSTTPLTSFGATGRPAWLALDSGTGVLSGIPTEATTTALSIALTASNADGASSPKTLLLTVAPAPATPLITSALTAGGRVGTAFTYQVTASETPTSYVALGLPGGLALNATSGLITGTPLISDTYNVTLRAANASGLGASSTLVIAVAPALAAPAITSTAAVSGQVGALFTYQIVASNGPITSYAVTGALPLGVTLNTTTGVISGTPADDPRTYLIQITATNAGGTSLPQSLAITVAPTLNAPVVTTPLYVVGTVGVDFSLTITATNITGSAPYAPPISLEAVGLPSGLAVNPATGAILGRPLAVGTTVATLVATNAAGTGPTRDLTIFVLPAPTAPVVSSASVAVGQVGQPFSYQILATNPPLTSYEVLGAPAWMTLNPVTGAVTGTPTAPGSFLVRLTATNAVGTSSPAILGLFISPAAGTPVITSTRTASGTVGTAFTYTPAATPAATGYVAAGLPGGLSLNATTGALSGTPTGSGTFNVILTPANAAGVGAPVTLVITILPNVTFAS